MGLLDTTRFLVTHPLGKRAPLRALGRFAAWQIASRTSPGAIAVPFVGDSRLLVERGMTGATGNVYVGMHEFEDMAFVLHALRTGDLFLDVGANIGSYTVLAAKVVGCGCVSVEPIAATVRKLRDNLALNHVVQRVDVHECAAGDVEGFVHMTTEHDTVNRVLPSQRQGTSSIPTRTLDALLGDRPVTLFKMDVEGYELPALRGASKLLSHPGLAACIIETLGGDAHGADVDPISTLLAGYGFRPATYDPWHRRLAPSAHRNPIGNTLFVRNWAELTERLRTATAFEVLGQTC